MEEFVKKNYSLLTFLLVGLILIGLGVFVFKNGGLSKNNSVEVLNGTTEGENNTSGIVVEIAGAVEKPGVYSFKEGSRIDDLLIVSGGISGNADRIWVEKTINRAAKLTDGQKLYIPQQSEVLSANIDMGNKVYQDDFSTRSSGLININTATLSELDTLPGIGPVYGQSIIEHRPYSMTEELVSKEALKSSTYEKIKNLISVY